MPKPDGYETYKMIKEHSHDAKIILSTGASNLEKLSQINIENENYIITKPFTTSELSRKLRNVFKQTF